MATISFNSDMAKPTDDAQIYFLCLCRTFTNLIRPVFVFVSHPQTAPMNVFEAHEEGDGSSHTQTHGVRGDSNIVFALLLGVRI